MLCLKKPQVLTDQSSGEPESEQEETAGVAAVARRVPGNGNMSSRTESVGFGDLPLHVLENLMYHVLQLGDVDAVRSCRLVCKAWNSSVAVNITAAVLRPMTRSAQEISATGRPIINYAADGLRVPPRTYYSSITLDVLESAYRVFVPEPEEDECEEKPVTLEDAQQAENRAQSLWGRMQAVGGRQLTAQSLDSIGHYPAEDSSYCDSESQDDGDPDVELSDEELKDRAAGMPACPTQPSAGPLPPSGIDSSVHVGAVNARQLPQGCGVHACEPGTLPANGAAHAVELGSAAGEDDAAPGRFLHTTSQRRWFRSVPGGSSAGDEHPPQLGPRRRSWLRPTRGPSQAHHSHRSPVVNGTSEDVSGDPEIGELVRCGSGRRRGGWFRHTRGASDTFSDGTRGSSGIQMDWEDSNLSDEKAPGAAAGVSPPTPSNFPRLGGWLRTLPARGASPDGEEPPAQDSWLPGMARANARGPLQPAGGAVITLENEELDAFAKELRQQFIHGGGELPTVVLHVDAEGAEQGSSRTFAAHAVSTADGASRATEEAGARQRRGLRQMIGRDHSHGGEVGASPSGATGVQISEVPGRRAASSDARASTTAASSAAGEVLNERQKQVLNFLTQVEEGADIALEEIPVADSTSAAPADVQCSGDEDVDKHPTKRCMFMQGPAEQPAASKHRKQIIIPGYHYTNTCSVDLKLLRKFKKLQVLALPLATRAVDPEDLAALTQLTSLTISMRRRNHLGLGKRLQYLPPPSHFDGIWKAIVQLSELRSLNLAHSNVSERQIASLTALTGLEALDLTGVQLPVSTLRTFALLTCLTQLRIPNVTIVSERFMQLIGESRDAPRLAEMLDAMPQLRHLDLYCVEHGENQTILKDPKHMRTLAHATQLQRLDIAKLGQVTDSALALLQGLTALTALKLGCNTFDLYPLTGRAFIMFRTWEYLRVLYLEACRMPELRVLELVSMRLVPNSKIAEVCAGMHHLRPGMADHIITLKKYGVQNLGKFGESVRGGLIGKMLGY